MPSEYLFDDEYADYGLSATTSAASVRQASSLIDNYLGRPEGLVWLPDSLGRPAYMASLAPPSGLGSPTLHAAIAPGSSVVIPWFYPTYDLIGEVFIVDRADADRCEPVTVIGVDLGHNTITLARVLKSHDAGATLEAGLCIAEERPLPANRSIARISRPQLVGLLSAVGRYGFGRRSDQFGGMTNELNMLVTMQTLGAQQTWQPIDAGNVSISPITGECWITPGLMLAYFSEVRLRFVAGFPAAGLPDALKQATANVVNNIDAGADMSPVFKVLQAGGTKMERFSDSFIDGYTKAALSSYKVRLMA